MRMPLWLLIVPALFVVAPFAGASDYLHSVSYRVVDGQPGEVIQHQIHDRTGYLTDDFFEEYSYPSTIVEHAAIDESAMITVVRGPNVSHLETILRERGVQLPFPLAATPAEKRAIDSSDNLNDEVITIVESGPATNRINLVFMGDGYTTAERDKFVSDIERLVNDMFIGDTFQSYLPVFNVYAVFRASRQSGLGRNNRPRDTAYRLYRDGNTLRAIYPGNPAAIRSSCRAAPGCDYPVVIANDPHYGGLGGEFAISTSSETSGTMVLRHELGHNFGRVGEEYDGGGYFGNNHSSSLNQLKWRHWATDNRVRAEPSAARFLAWPWHNLANSPYRVQFRSNGNYASASMRLSASGIDSAERMEISINGNPLSYEAPGYLDRAFHDFELPPFSSGSHTLTFRQTEQQQPSAWVSSLAIHEYGADYNFDPDFIGAYPVYNQSGRVAGYRSNHETCLMRNMRSTVFCAVCQENNWLHFFAKIRLIDGVEIVHKDDVTFVELRTPSLGQFRDPLGARDRLQIEWYHNGQPVDELAGTTSWHTAQGELGGRWQVRVTFQTPEVRRDTNRRLQDMREFRL